MDFYKAFLNAQGMDVCEWMKSKQVAGCLQSNDALRTEEGVWGRQELWLEFEEMFVCEQERQMNWP